MINDRQIQIMYGSMNSKWESMCSVFPQIPRVSMFPYCSGQFIPTNRYINYGTSTLEKYFSWGCRRRAVLHSSSTINSFLFLLLLILQSDGLITDVLPLDRYILLKQWGYSILEQGYWLLPQKQDKGQATKHWSDKTKVDPSNKHSNLYLLIQVPESKTKIF